MQPQQTSIGEVATLAQECRGNITSEPIHLVVTPPRCPPPNSPPKLPPGALGLMHCACRYCLLCLCTRWRAAASSLSATLCSIVLSLLWDACDFVNEQVLMSDGHGLPYTQEA